MNEPKMAALVVSTADPASFSCAEEGEVVAGDEITQVVPGPSA
jgi:hypothetical protein